MCVESEINFLEGIDTWHCSPLYFSESKIGWIHVLVETHVSFLLETARRVANPRGEAFLCGPKGEFWPDEFSKKILRWVPYLF